MLVFVVLFVVPSPAVFDHSGVDVGVAHHDGAKRPSVAIIAGISDRDFTTKDHVGQSLFRLGAKALFGFRCVDALKADSDLLLVDQYLDGVTVRYSDDFAGERVGVGCACGKRGESCNRGQDGEWDGFHGREYSRFV